ncbi:MAG: hypothetical protein PCFJNLEI_00883 [Verrucomicrobiae bacterium]|nr:hypothetical protein [Verrucomicrobiae bacterium]
MVNHTFRPGAVWLDTSGEPIHAHSGGMFYEHGVYYWYGTHMGAGKTGNLAEVGIVCYRSTDLYNWENVGVILPVVRDIPGHDLTVGCRLERPKIVFNDRTRQYVLWFHLVESGHGHESAWAGIAVSDYITGPYRYLKKIHPAGFDVRDMTLYKDGDGAVYLFYAAGLGDQRNNTMHVARLTDNYLAASGEYRAIFPDRFMEAPALCRWNDTYYLIASGCTSWDPNQARAARAPHPFGPWTETGDPCEPHPAEDSLLTYHSQSSYIFPVANRPGAFILMADRWNPQNHIDGRHVWLPVFIENNRLVLRWYPEWCS